MISMKAYTPPFKRLGIAALIVATLLALFQPANPAWAATAPLAFEEAKAAADSGDSHAQAIVAMHYSLGWQVEKNPELALQYANQSASAGDALGLYRLGALLRSGEGVTKDEEEALYMLGRHGPRRSGKVVAVLAGPKNGLAFAEAVRAQARRVMEERLDENPPSPDVRDFDSWRAPVAPVKARRPTFAAVQEELEPPGADRRSSCSVSSQPASDHDQDQEHTAGLGYQGGASDEDTAVAPPTESVGADVIASQEGADQRRQGTIAG